MEPLTTAALVGGGIAAGQGIISSAFNAFQANKQMDFQERMSNTAHQREVADLRKAGLNPILSARHGGASSPPGSAANAASPDIAQAANSARSTAQQGSLIPEQRILLRAQADDTNSAKALKDAQAADVNNTQLSRISETIARTYATLQSGNLSGEQRGKVLQEIRNLEAQRRLLNVQTNAAKAELERKKLLSKPFEAVNRELESIPKKGGAGNYLKEKAGNYIKRYWDHYNKGRR